MDIAANFADVLDPDLPDEDRRRLKERRLSQIMSSTYMQEVARLLEENAQLRNTIAELNAIVGYQKAKPAEKEKDDHVSE